MKKMVLLIVILLSFFVFSKAYAKEVELNLKKVDALALTTPIDVDGDKIRDYGVQSLVVTTKYIVIAFNYINDETQQNYFYIYDKDTYKLVSKKQVYSCGHANGMTYESTNNQIVCANGGEHLFVVYDANTFKKVKIVKYPTGYSINNISYDPDTKTFWATRGWKQL